MVCDKMVEAAEAEEEAGEEAGYRLKNKSPAQRCGEKQRVNHEESTTGYTSHLSSFS